MVPVRLASLVIFLFIVLGMYVFYFNPLVWLMNEEQKRTVMFLLLIPSSVYFTLILYIYFIYRLESMTSLRKFVQSLSEDNDINST